MRRHLISFMILFPFLGALAQVCISFLKRKSEGSFAFCIGVGCSLVSSLFGLALLASLLPGQQALQAVEFFPWMGSFEIYYSVGADGLNILLVLLISLVFPLLIGMEWKAVNANRGVIGLLLLAQGALLGGVCAQDFFLLFFFWSLSAVPFYFLVGIWGGAGREKAAFRYSVSSAIGNAFFFLVLVLVYYFSEPHSFALRALEGGPLTQSGVHFLGVEFSVSSVLLFLLGLAFAFRVPLWPLQGWFSDFAAEAPSGALVALSAVFVPVATGIFFRLICFLFPKEVPDLAPVLLFVGALNLLVGVVVGAAQRELRQIFAFLCVSEVGLLLIGFGSLSLVGTVGAIYQQLSIGLGLASFGIFCGLLLKRSEGWARGGIAKGAPQMAILAALVIASVLGLPGFGGFIGRSLILIGGFPEHALVVVWVCFAFVVATYSLLSVYKKIFFGPFFSAGENFLDLSIKEKVCLFPLVLSLLFLGLYPKPLLSLIQPSVESLLLLMR